MGVMCYFVWLEGKFWLFVVLGKVVFIEICEVFGIYIFDCVVFYEVLERGLSFLFV